MTKVKHATKNTVAGFFVTGINSWFAVCSYHITS